MGYRNTRDDADFEVILFLKLTADWRQLCSILGDRNRAVLGFDAASHTRG